MTDPGEPDPFDAYRESHSGPDATTTARLHGRLDDYVANRDARRRKKLLMRLAAVCVLSLGAAAGVWFWPSEPEAVELVADDVAQTMALPADGTLEVLPPGRIRVLERDDDGVLLELVDGAARLSMPEGSTGRWRIRSGPYEVEGAAATFTVTHTDAAPEVTVSRGQARITGPNLPVEGVLIEPG